MQKYRRVALKDRIEIQARLIAGLKATEIAKALGFHKSTITREIKRHGGNEDYSALRAENKANANFKSCRRKLKLKGELLTFTLKKLKSGWSPVQVERRLQLEKSDHNVSYQTIYRFVNRLDLKKTHLRFGYKRRGFGRKMRQDRCRKSSWKLSIHQRPQEANNRLELGHWERDTIFDNKRRSLLIFTDRKSRFTLLAKNPNLKSKDVAARTMKVLKNLPAKTLTNDNGSEFFDTKSISIPTYFCDVLKPGQRGTVENTIGLLRRFVKRENNIVEMSHRKIKALENQINLRPRKCLDYKTPYEIFYKTNVALAL